MDHNSLKSKRQQLEELSIYLAGAAAYIASMSKSNELADKLKEASEDLKEASENVCAQGYYGCEGGDQCTSDHK